MNVRCLAVAVAVALSPAVVEASPKGGIGAGHPMRNGTCGTPHPSASALRSLPHAGTPSKIIYLERCVGGCQFLGSTDHNAMTNQIAIAGTENGITYSFDEFKNFAGESGTAADAEWTQIVDCVRKVYSYYDTEVTDLKPATGTYHQAVVTGLPENLFPGAPADGLLGISDVGCGGPIHNMTSFTLADAHRTFENSGLGYVLAVCNTVAHEAGHSFGLEHEFEFVDGTSACNDPMSYDTGACDPPFRFFRNKPALCGGFELMPCFCTPQAQNSHTKLSSVFGALNPTIGVSTVAITLPAPDQQLGASIVVSAGHDRGVERVEFYINGYKWLTQQGNPFVPGGGQPNPGSHVFVVPPNLPNSIIDIQAKIYDDLGNVTDSAVVTAVKGAPCADASTCNEGQQCEEGRCFWDPPTGELGDPCTYPESCLSAMCSDTTIAGEGVCTRTCVPGLAGSCPDGLECYAVGNSGLCYLVAEDGCCSTSRGTPWGPLVFAGVVLGWLLRRKRL